MTMRARDELQTIPNVGPATAGDLRRLGLSRPAELIGKNADDLYDRICAIDGVRHDPCLRDVFRAAIDFAEGGAPRPWWTFTPERKAQDAQRASSSKLAHPCPPARRSRKQDPSVSKPARSRPSHRPPTSPR